MELVTEKEASIALRVIRCGCGDPASHGSSVCPTPRADQDLGVVAYTSTNPFKRLLWRMHGKADADRRIEEANRS